ncbi:hypothetical protein NQ317_014426 [Molorchus minor]|uniref:Ig-like domain-containing protein n=1 Tax=Molorchus minor TaxID=1323400 RepID=A0ABQ9K5C8_9CUCU|nr:hypothetical protein NQ317_014426 [Molorchus minor]
MDHSLEHCETSSGGCCSSFIINKFARAVETPQTAVSLRLTDPKDLIVSKGQSAILRCDAVSTSDGLKIKWLHNDLPLPTNDTRWSQQSDGSLYIPKTTSGKKANGVTGEYACLVSNKVGALRSNTAKLRVACEGKSKISIISYKLSKFDAPPAQAQLFRSRGYGIYLGMYKVKERKKILYR